MRRCHRWRSKKSVHIRFRVIVVLALLLWLIIIIDSHFRPIVNSIVTNTARIKSIDTINNVITEELNQKGVSYNDIINVERDEDGKVLAITTQMVKMNELKAEVISKVQKELGDNGHTDVGVPIGTFLGDGILHGRGPKVPLKLTLSGNVNGDFKSKFESAGINQTKHQIYLNIHTSVYSFMPGFDTTTDVETNVLIAETIIIGDVPKVVANLK